MRLKPVITDKYVTVWYRTAEAIAHAERILILGHSLRSGDALETVCKDACVTFQQPENRYTPITVQGHPARKYDNRITVVGADLREFDLAEWLD